MESPIERTYSLQNISMDQLSKAVDELWGQLQTDPGTQAVARKQGIEPNLLRTLSRSDVLTIERSGAGFDPATTAVVVAFAPVAAKIVLDTWEKFILPRLLR